LNYQHYVIAAYAVFVLVLLWDWLAPIALIRQQLRAARRRVQRRTANTE